MFVKCERQTSRQCIECPSSTKLNLVFKIFVVNCNRNKLMTQAEQIHQSFILAHYIGHVYTSCTICHLPEFPLINKCFWDNKKQFTPCFVQKHYNFNNFRQSKQEMNGHTHTINRSYSKHLFFRYFFNHNKYIKRNNLNNVTNNRTHEMVRYRWHLPCCVCNNGWMSGIVFVECESLNITFYLTNVIWFDQFLDGTFHTFEVWSKL